MAIIKSTHFPPSHGSPDSHSKLFLTNLILIHTTKPHTPHGEYFIVFEPGSSRIGTWSVFNPIHIRKQYLSCQVRVWVVSEDALYDEALMLIIVPLTRFDLDMAHSTFLR
jgi:hypothetical protein